MPGEFPLGLLGTSRSVSKFAKKRDGSDASSVSATPSQMIFVAGNPSPGEAPRSSRAHVVHGLRSADLRPPASDLLPLTPDPCPLTLRSSSPRPCGPRLGAQLTEVTRRGTGSLFDGRVWDLGGLGGRPIRSTRLARSHNLSTCHRHHKHKKGSRLREASWPKTKSDLAKPPTSESLPAVNRSLTGAGWKRNCVAGRGRPRGG